MREIDFFIGLLVQNIKLQPSRTETENNFAYLLEWLQTKHFLVDLIMNV